MTGPREPYAGETNPEISPQVLAELNYLLRKARRKYGPLEDNFRLLGAMRLEYKEVERAIQAREDWHVRAELLDLANVCIRRVLEMDAASKTKTPTPKEITP